MNTMKTKPLHDRSSGQSVPCATHSKNVIASADCLRSSGNLVKQITPKKNVVLPQTTNTVPVNSIILILKITKELNQQFNTYNLYGLSSFLNSLVARHQTCSSIVALSAAYQKHTKNRRLAHASTMLGVPLCYDSHTRNGHVELVADSSASFFSTLQVKRLPEPGFSLRGEDNVQNGQQAQVPFKLSRDYSFEEEGFED